MSPLNPSSSSEETPSNDRVSRRSVSVAAAWTVPAVAVAVSAPLAAASTDPVDPTATYTLVVTSSPFVTTTCGVIPAGTVTFLAQKNGAAAPANGAVVITLPVGLSFVAGGQTATVLTQAGGIVSVPAFTVTGAAGTYTISAAYNGQTAYATGVATATAGSVYSFVRGSTTTTLVPSISGSTAATSGWGTGNNFVITTAGTVSYWGTGVGGATAAAPGTLATSSGPLTSVTKIASATMNNGNTTSGLALVGNQVYSWNVTNAVPVAKPITTSGTVRSIWAWNGSNYVLTDTGLYYWGQYFGNAATTTPPVATTGYLNSTLSSTWGFYIRNTYYTGGTVVIGGVPYSWTAPGSTLDAADLNLQSGGPTNITKVKANQSSTLALTATGELWTRGPAYTTSPGANGWVKRATSVSDFDSWGNTDASGVGYSGGAYQTYSGQVVQFGANAGSAGAYKTQVMGGLTGVVATKIYAFDGVYYLLASNGNAYTWIGNMDVPSRETSAGQLNVGGVTLVDLAPWGLAGWSGGGVAISPSSVCA